MESLIGAPLLGAADSLEIAEEYGRLLALNCRALGANSTWSPVVDLPCRFAVSGTMRASTDKPDHLVPISLAMVKGGQENGIGMCAKHFSGKDKIEYRDSHFVCPKIGCSKEEWWKKQGKVFQDMIVGGLWAIMPGHRASPPSTTG